MIRMARLFPIIRIAGTDLSRQSGGNGLAVFAVCGERERFSDHNMRKESVEC